MIALLLAAQVAEASPPAAPSDEVVVTGERAGTLDLKRLQAAQRAFVENRARFAPAASLFFELRQGGAPAGGATLTLRRRDGAEVGVPLGPDGRFVLPTVEGRGWQLLHDRGRSAMAVRVRVFSPGTSEGDRRMGDLRLQCRASWEVFKGGSGVLARTAFAALGGCSSSRIGFYYQTGRPVVRAALNGRALDLRPDWMAYRAPLGDKNVGNDARLAIVFR